MSSRRRGRAAAVLLGLGLALATRGWALEVPYLAGRVNDLAGMLSTEAAERIEQRLVRLEEETGAQVALLLLPSLEGESLEEYSLRVSETWGLGRQGADDGLLLLVARDDRKMRLEVGYGLEGKIPDALAGRILDLVVRPRFREGRFDEGLEAAVEAIEGRVRGGAEALPVASASPRASPKDAVARWLMFAFFAFIIGQFSLAALASRGAHGWFLYVFLIPFWSVVPLALIGAAWGIALGALWIVGYPPLRLFLQRTPAGRKLRDSTRLGRHSSSPGRWSSSGGGWSSGGGGFSGGGGSFGGGGASSSW